MSKADQSDEWASLAALRGFPFKSFSQLQQSVREKSFRIGVDPLSAAEWSASFNTTFKKTVVSALSIILIAAGVASAIVAIWFADYWLLAAVPIEVLAFYLSHPASAYRRWVTVGGVVSVVAFADLLLNGLVTAALLTAYAALTFAAVRSAGFIANSAFRCALASEEALFVAAYRNGACTLLDTTTKKVYEHDVLST